MSAIFRALKDFNEGDDKALGTIQGPLGTSGANGILILILLVIGSITLGLFVNSHAIYLSTGTPIFKWNLLQIFGQPFFSFWSVFKIISVHVLGAPSKASSFEYY